MKNTSPMTAVLFLGVATAVGAAAWMLSGTAPDEGVAAPLERPTADAGRVAFEAISPKERRKQVNLESTKRELKRISEVGTEVSPGLYMIMDSSGDPTYYSTELIEGRGRNGEPLYMTAEFKKIHTAPLRDGLNDKAITRKRLNPKTPKGTLQYGGKQSGGGGATGATGGGSSGGTEGGSGGSGGASGSAGGGTTGGPATGPGDGDG